MFMKPYTSALVWTFISCWFMGVTVISIGFGDIFPSLNRVAQPLVCPNGSMEMDQEVYYPYPGKTVTTTTWYCVDEASGTQTELAVFPMALYTGTLYGILLFVVVVVAALLVIRKLGPALEDHVVIHKTHQPSEDTHARMKKLKELRAADLISEKEYEQKRAKILKNL
jgi:uncharacterized membrane protein